MKKKKEFQIKKMVCPKGKYPRAFETKYEKGKYILYIYFEEEEKQILSQEKIIELGY